MTVQTPSGETPRRSESADEHADAPMGVVEAFDRLPRQQALAYAMLYTTGDLLAARDVADGSPEFASSSHAGDALGRLCETVEYVERVKHPYRPRQPYVYGIVWPQAESDSGGESP